MLLLHGPKEVHEIVFDDITGDLIQKTVVRTKRAAGLSKFDAGDWRRNKALQIQKRNTKKLYSQKLIAMKV